MNMFGSSSTFFNTYKRPSKLLLQAREISKTEGMEALHLWIKSLSERERTALVMEMEQNVRDTVFQAILQTDDPPFSVD